MTVHVPRGRIPVAALLIRCSYGTPRRFLNRVPKFDSWRGHLRETGISRRQAATPPVGIASDADAACARSILAGNTPSWQRPGGEATALPRALSGFPRLRAHDRDVAAHSVGP